MSDPVKMIGAASLFEFLDAEERTSLARMLGKRRLAAGEILFSRGDPGDALYLIHSGRMRLSLENDLGQTIVLNESQAGDLFGEIGFFGGGPRAATATAVEETELLALGRDKLLEFLDLHPHAALDLLTVMENRVRTASDILAGSSLRNLNEEHDDRSTFGQRMADKVAAFGGSWSFIIVFVAILMVWMGINIFLLVERPFDPYPFILLNLVLSSISAFQAPIIMMSQNRQTVKDRLKADLDYDVNIKAEMEVAQLHRKIDRIYEAMQAHFARSEQPQGNSGQFRPERNCIQSETRLPPE